jgi:ketosteroid isomerase-like protein
MSEENVEVVREHIEAYRRLDAPVAFSLMDPHAILDMSRIDGSDPSHGREAIEEAVTRYRGTFEDYDYKVGRLSDLGSGAILAVVTETGRGKGSCVPVDRGFATLYTVIDGKIARITQFRTEEEALEASKPPACRSSCFGREAALRGPVYRPRRPLTVLLTPPRVLLTVLLTPPRVLLTVLLAPPVPGRVTLGTRIGEDPDEPPPEEPPLSLRSCRAR